MELPLFEEVAEILRGMVPSALGELHQQARRYGIKVWFGPAKAPREHYEAQVIGADQVAGASVLALELGFHSEYPEIADNEDVIAHLLNAEDRWRPVLGDEAVAGPFLGRPDVWRRVSETWPDPDLDDAELALEIAARLSDYIVALESVRHPR